MGNKGNIALYAVGLNPTLFIFTPSLYQDTLYTEIDHTLPFLESFHHDQLFKSLRYYRRTFCQFA